MLEFFSKELRDGLAMASTYHKRKKSRLSVQAGGQSFPVLRFWADGLAIEASHTTHLRGLVDIYDGSRHIFQCLIVAAEADGTELVCEFKRLTAVHDRAALDYVRDENAPIGYLPSA